MISAASSILIGAALRALLSACAVGAGLWLLRVKNVKAQKNAWSIVLVAAFAMPLFLRWQWLPAWAEVRLPAYSWSSAPQPARAAADSHVTPEATPSELETLSAATGETPLVAVRPAAQPMGRSPQKANRAPLNLLIFCWLIYLAVGALLLLRLLLGLGSSIRLWLLAEPVEARQAFGPSGVLSVRSSNSIASPVNIGSGIVLPADYVDWDAEKLRVVLAHESSHIRQRDFYLQLLAALYAAIVWFSPLGWWLKRKLTELGEAIGDRAALDESVSRSAYAHLLLEFAALPGPNLKGVAMAHSSNLSRRIERLLNDASFQQAFAGSRRALLCASIASAVLVAAAALVHVQAAATPNQSDWAQIAKPSSDQLPSPPSFTGQSHPDSEQGTNQDSGQAKPRAGAAVPAPAAAPAPPAMPATPMSPAPAASAQKPAPPASAVLPAPPIGAKIQIPAVQVYVPAMPPMIELHTLLQAKIDNDIYGEAYAIVGAPGTGTRFFGAWDVDRETEVEKARKIAHGRFLLFRHGGKSYVVDDPAIVSQIEAMEKDAASLDGAMQELGRQMREANKQQIQAALKAHETGRNIPAPDLSKEMADLNAAVANLHARPGATVTHQQLAEVERKVNELQRSLLSAQMKMNFDAMTLQFHDEQGKFGGEMGKLGAQMGRTARENTDKTREIIDRSLKDGKARPVE